MSYKSIKCRTSDKILLDSLAKQSNVSKVEYISLCLEYFRKTGIDPKEDVVDVLTQIKKTENRLISFIKTQDKVAQKQFEIMSSELNSINSSVNNQGNIVAKLLNKILKLI